MPSLMDRVYGAYRGFREPAMFADPTGGKQSLGYGGSTSNEWGDWQNRQLRYRLLWAFYEQNAFRDVQGWPQHYRSTYGLYEGVRDLFGVAHKLGEFHTSHLQGGELDPQAGDGREVPSALPILMDAEDPAIRDALAELWKRSNWAINKDVLVRFGATTGDAFIEVCDDEESETVRLNVLPAGRVKWNDLSNEGNVEAYELEYMRPDPRQIAAKEDINAVRLPMVRYNEVITPEPGGGGYRWKTYLDGQVYAWPGNPGSDWVIPDLPFAPLVKVQHKNIGMGWGHAEAHASLTGVREVADLASCLTDWARKALFAPHMITGTNNPDNDPVTQARASRAPLSPAQQRSGYGPGGEWAANGWGWGQSGAEANARNKQNYLYVKEPNARARSLIHPMPVIGIGAQIDRLKQKTQDDYPELSFERIRTSGKASAEAIREARKPAEAKIQSRRIEYDDASVRAFRMAITLGGLRGYQHYQGFSAGSYDEGALDFSIGKRPAFASDPAEEIALRQARYTSMSAALNAGLPLAIAMREAGYSEEDIAVAEKAKADAQAQAMAMAKTQFSVSEKLATP